MSKRLSVQEWMEFQANYIAELSNDLGADYILDILQDTYQIGYTEGMLKTKDQWSEQAPDPRKTDSLEERKLNETNEESGEK